MSKEGEARTILQAEITGSNGISVQLAQLVKEVRELNSMNDLDLPAGVSLLTTEVNKCVDFIAAADRELFEEYGYRVDVEDGRYVVKNRRDKA